MWTVRDTVQARRLGAHPQSELVEALVASDERVAATSHDQEVRAWLRAVGAPLAAPASTDHPPLAEMVGEALRLAHRDAGGPRAAAGCSGSIGMRTSMPSSQRRPAETSAKPSGLFLQPLAPVLCRAALAWDATVSHRPLINTGLSPAHPGDYNARTTGDEPSGRPE